MATETPPHPERVKGSDLFGMNSCQLLGRVIRISKAGNSFLVMLQYGPARESSDESTQFVNMVEFRVPQEREFIMQGVEQGSVITCYGRVNSPQLAGMHNTLRDMETEIVIERIRLGFGDPFPGSSMAH